MDTVPALSEHVNFVVLREKFDIHAIADLVPGQIRQCLLVTAQPSFGRSHEVGDRRIAHPHFFENLFSRNASVHHPYALCFAVLFLDLLEEPSESGIVGGVAGHNLIGQGEAFRGNDQGNDHLHAV